MRWLVAKTLELREWGWGPISNGDAIDTSQEKMMDIVDEFNDEYILQICWYYPTIQEVWGSVVQEEANSGSGVWLWSKGACSVCQIEEWVFDTSDLTNDATDECLVQLGNQW